MRILACVQLSVRVYQRKRERGDEGGRITQGGGLGVGGVSGSMLFLKSNFEMCIYYRKLEQDIKHRRNRGSALVETMLMERIPSRGYKCSIEVFCTFP